MSYKVHAIIKGKVQKVGFRAFTKDIATKLGLKGFVKNLENGDVELLAVGPKENLLKLLEELKKGPPLSLVSDINYELEEIKDEETNLFSDFRIVY